MQLHCSFAVLDFESRPYYLTVLGPIYSNLVNALHCCVGPWAVGPIWSWIANDIYVTCKGANVGGSLKFLRRQ